jgi:2-C-methyl-D-erythritol 4-phosphate cytidylyltransferase
MVNTPTALTEQFIVVVPAAGVGKRMQANCPKQYLTINQKTILEHTVERLLSHPAIAKVIIALGEHDEYFPKTSLSSQSAVLTVVGGKERVDSVLAGLLAIDTNKYTWVLVHDAARPCVSLDDITTLIERCLKSQSGGLLAAAVRDTMKRSATSKNGEEHVLTTVDREKLWHALTPQMYKVNELKTAIIAGLNSNVVLTDESSAIELANLPSLLVPASSENIKITQPDDLALAAFYLNKQAQENLQEIK